MTVAGFHVDPSALGGTDAAARTSKPAPGFFPRNRAARPAMCRHRWQATEEDLRTEVAISTSATGTNDQLTSTRNAESSQSSGQNSTFLAGNLMKTAVAKLASFCHMAPN